MNQQQTSTDEHEKIQSNTTELNKNKNSKTNDKPKNFNSDKQRVKETPRNTYETNKERTEAKNKRPAYFKVATEKKGGKKYIPDNASKHKTFNKLNSNKNVQAVNMKKNNEEISVITPLKINIVNKKAVEKEKNVFEKEKSVLSNANKEFEFKKNFKNNNTPLIFNPDVEKNTGYIGENREHLKQNLPYFKRSESSIVLNQSAYDKSTKIIDKLFNKNRNKNEINKITDDKMKLSRIQLNEPVSNSVRGLEACPENTELNKEMNTLNINSGEKNEKAKRNVSILQEIYHKLHKSDDKLKSRLLGKLQVEMDRTSDVARIRDASWELFNLSPALLQAINDLKFLYPSPVQVESIPEALLEKNLIVRAKNGTGKTLSFVVPILERSIREKATTDFALIMVPTRELAMQIGKVVRRVGTHCSIEAIATFGGSTYYEDILRIKRGVGIIVGTPGRVFDLINKTVLNIENFKILALDEADKLLAIEYRENIGTIIQRFSNSQNKQIMMFSATYPVEISDFTDKFIKNHKEINLMPELCLKGVSQFFTKVKFTQKLHCLRTLIRMTKFDKCIIFCNSIAAVEKLGYKVGEMNIPCYFFHSHMHIDDRKNIFHQFTATDDIPILIATDLITRGIDVPNVNLVINFDFPGSAESFLHRIGRAGRFGRTGCSISMCDAEEIDEMKWIERQTGVEIKGISHLSFNEFKVADFINK